MQLTQTNDLGDKTMAQAKTLTTAEIERLLTHINTRKYSARNRSMMLLTHWAGLRIGEVACLRWPCTDKPMKRLPGLTGIGSF